MKDLGQENPYTRLAVDLKGVDPDDAFCAIPYEKGHAILFYLEQLVGGPGKLPVLSLKFNISLFC